MSKATSVITDRFKYKFFQATGEDTTEVQKALFMMGFRWSEGHRNVINERLGYIRVDENGEMWRAEENPYRTHPNAYSHVVGEYHEVSRNDILNAAEEVRKIKRKESKEQKKRAAKRKWERTSIKHVPGECPVAPETVVSVRLRDGEINSGKAGEYKWAALKGWEKDYTIDSYKILKQKPKIVALEDFFAAVAHDIGKGVAIPVHDYERHPLDVASDPEGLAVVEAGKPLHAAMQADTNPKRQYGVASVPLNMWSPLASAYGSLGLYNGALKYGKANFANTPVEASIYIAAAFRHLSAWACGQEFDPADGVPNLGGVLANIAILLEARAAGTLIDDRLKMAGYLKEIEQLKEIVKHLNKLHEGKNPKHYTMES